MRFFCRKHLLLALLLLPLQLWATSQHFADRPDVQQFIAHLVKKDHFNKAALITLFNTVQQRPSVMHNLRVPLESQPWYLYRRIFITDHRTADGAAFWQRNNAMLIRAQTLYGVPPEIIVATIGIESKFGKSIGKYRVLDALANIAFSQSRRAAFFRYELEEFLLLSREQHFDPYTVKGSYAGAMGQLQFMPDSYRRYGASMAGNKKIDLYHNEADIIGSVANYYHQHGWQTNQPVATRIGWLEKLMMPASRKNQLITLENYLNNEYWCTYPNFGVIKKYNPSNLYAMAVFQLGNKIKDRVKRTDK